MFAVLLLSEAHERRNRMRIQRRNLRDTTNPFEMPEERFRELFRLTRDAAQILLTEMSPHMHQGQRKTFIPIPIRLCAALHFYASGSYQRDIGQDFSAAMSRTMISRIVGEVSLILQNKFSGKWIKFPREDEYDSIKQRFFEATGFPGVIGAIDCTHVKIQKPNMEVEACYLNRKGYHSKNVQLICDFNLQILGVYARFGGASHDSFIWEASSIKTLLEQRCEINGVAEQSSWLLGDSGYPLRPWLMTPYRSSTDANERAFNTIHAKTRNCIERLNGVLKSVFRCLKIGLFYSPAAAGRIINACCVLHNFRIKHGIYDDIPIEELNNDDENIYHPPENNSVHHRAALRIRDRLKANILR
ncbi:putative nuclease HARBI1 [Episyrphus balteatus]|uniref:putative nuclease HARBI1 n=1 Tax=Episyrphus balteatus TaxID=286459 RepID=UPI002485CEB0|nr:putative nuclease HARBI1 [Episyrphus balteatus]